MAEFEGDRMWGLKELPLPDPVPWIPATPGWLVVGGVLFAALGWLAWRRWRVWQRRRYRREALAQLHAMRDARGALAKLPLLLRTTALAAYPRDEVASLRGTAWVAWLNEHGGRFAEADAEHLDRLPYDARSVAALEPESAARLLAASRSFVRDHRAQL